MRPWLIAAALLAPLSGPPLFAPPPAQAAGTLRFGLDFDLDTFDPARSGSYIERIVNLSMCDQLLNLDASLNIVPELATAWDWSPDRLALTLHLRDGVQFQDGTALDAEAVRANLERYRSAPYSARRGELKPVASIDASARAPTACSARSGCPCGLGPSAWALALLPRHTERHSQRLAPAAAWHSDCTSLLEQKL